MPSPAPPSSPLDPPVAFVPERPDLLRAGPAPGPQRSPNAVTGISLVLPCYNEAENVEAAIAGALAAGARCATDYEVIVVDDGSRDETAAIVADYVARDGHVRLIAHAANRGYGDAVRSGIEAARMDWVFLTDADLQFELAELEDFLPFTATSDLIAGWRILRQDPLHRRMNAAAWNWLVGHVFHLPVRDVDCAFKLMRRELAQGCALQCSGAMISTELLVKALAQGARMNEIGVHHLPRVAGTSSGARPRVILGAFRELAVLRLALRPGGRPSAAHTAPAA